MTAQAIQVDQTTADVLHSLIEKAETDKPLIVALSDGQTVVIHTADAYQKLLDELDRADAIRGIEEGKADKAAGRVRPATEFFAELRTELEAQKKGQA